MAFKLNISEWVDDWMVAGSIPAPTLHMFDVSSGKTLNLFCSQWGRQQQQSHIGVYECEYYEFSILFLFIFYIT